MNNNNYDNLIFSKKGSDKKVLDSTAYSHAPSNKNDIEYRRIRISSDIDNEIKSNIVDFIRDINIFDQNKKENNIKDKSLIKKKLMIETDKDEIKKFNFKLIEIEEREKEITKPINIYLSTPGGSVKHGFEIIDAIRTSKTPIHIFATGMVASMGVPILLSGHKRFGSKYCQYMIHEISGFMRGSLTKIQESIDEGREYYKLIYDIFQERSKVSKEFLDNINKNKEDYILYSKEALKLEIIDEII